MGNIHRTDSNRANRDPRTGDSGSRPVGTTTGDAFNPSLHDIYWRDAYSREPNAKDAVRAAWHRVERLMPGDFDDDGR